MKLFVTFLAAFLAATFTLVGAATSESSTTVLGAPDTPWIPDAPDTLWMLASKETARAYQMGIVNQARIGIQRQSGSAWVGIPDFEDTGIPVDATDEAGVQSALTKEIVRLMNIFITDGRVSNAGDIYGATIECRRNDNALFGTLFNYRVVFQTFATFTISRGTDGKLHPPATITYDLQEPDGMVFIDLPITDASGWALINGDVHDGLAWLYRAPIVGHGLGALVDKRVLGRPKYMGITLNFGEDVVKYDQTLQPLTGPYPIVLGRLGHSRDYSGNYVDYFEFHCEPGTTVVIESSPDLKVWIAVQVLTGHDEFPPGHGVYASGYDGAGLSAGQRQSLQAKKQSLGGTPSRLFYRAWYK